MSEATAFDWETYEKPLLVGELSREILLQNPVEGKECLSAVELQEIDNLSHFGRWGKEEQESTLRKARTRNHANWEKRVGIVKILDNVLGKYLSKIICPSLCLTSTRKSMAYDLLYSKARTTISFAIDEINEYYLIKLPAGLAKVMVSPKTEEAFSFQIRLTPQ